MAAGRRGCDAHSRLKLETEFGCRDSLPLSIRVVNMLSVIIEIALYFYLAVFF